MNGPNGEPYELVDVPGAEDVKILALSRSTTHTHHDESGAKSPWWMICIEIAGKAVTESLISGSADGLSLKTFAELHGFHIEGGINDNCEITNQLFGSGTRRHDDVVVIMQNANYLADIENAMHNGKFLTKVTIVETGILKSSWAVFQKIVFEDNLVLSIVHDLDRVFVRFRIKKKTVTYTSYDLKGTKEGNASFELDFSTHSNKIS